MNPEQPRFEDNLEIKGEQSRERIREKFDLGSDPKKFRILREKGLELQYGKLADIQNAQNLNEIGKILDAELEEIQNFFPGDAYGQRAREAFLQRIKEKTRDEVASWLRGTNREDLAQKTEQAIDIWLSLKDVADWIQKNILSQLDNAEELFRRARDSKISEFREYYLRQKG